MFNRFFVNVVQTHGKKCLSPLHRTQNGHYPIPLIQEGQVVSLILGKNGPLIPVNCLLEA